MSEYGHPVQPFQTKDALSNPSLINSFIQIAGWTSHNAATPPRSLQHLRSYSSSNVNRTAVTQSRPVSKSISSSRLHTMAAVSSAPGLPAQRNLSYKDEDSHLSTLPDPRSRTMSPANDTSPPTPSHHPDLSNEVATLSNKLISAINHQTSLDDTLSATRHELESSKERVRHLEQETQDHKELIARGILIRKSVSDLEKRKLAASLAEEKRQRAVVEKEKKNIEQELETLTAALFEEANKMVITAREDAQREHDIVSRRNDQLKAQLADTESLLKSHQEQLAELKQVMEHLTEERDDQTNQTEPSTPGLSKFDSKDEAQDVDVVTSTAEPVSPSYPTSFTHLLNTVLRTDLSSYDDFASLLRMSKNVVGNRASSGSYGTIGLGLGLGGHAPAQANGSATSLSMAGSFNSSPATPTTPASSVSTGSMNGPNSLTPLKETKFYKRALAEDIEPTLRLDTAPGLSWLARRTVLNAVCEGTLVVEPMPVSTRPYIFACSLCGETRKGPAHTRSHRFRASESDNAQRYPLCKYCLGRVRSTCDFLGFLRILKEGHWRADDEEAEKAAWEESVRLREQMFWCRVGGGVVPVQQIHHSDVLRSPRVSEDERREQEAKLSEEFQRTGEIRPRDVTPVIELPSTLKSPKRTIKVSTQNGTAESARQATQGDAAAFNPDAKSFAGDETPNESTNGASEQNSPEPHNVTRDSTLPTSSLQVASSGEEATDDGKRLSITIPRTSQ